jgi:hypothetical protein
MRFCNYRDGVLTDPVRADWQVFTYLVGHPDVRNLYVGSHENETQIGPAYTANIARAIQHRYHFLFLDGCVSKNNAWAFGFTADELSATQDLSYYQTPRLLRPAAAVAFLDRFDWYVCYDQHPTYVGYIPKEYAKFHTDFQGRWAVAGDGLWDAISFAAANGSGSNSGLPAGKGPWDQVTVVGYRNMRHNEYNRYNSRWW